MSSEQLAQETIDSLAKALNAERSARANDKRYYSLENTKLRNKLMKSKRRAKEYKKIIHMLTR